MNYNSPEDESPIPSEGVLSEEETSRQLRADSVRQYTEIIKQLEDVADMHRDEFKRIIALSDNTEVQGIAKRAIETIAQKVSVIKQRDELMIALSKQRANYIELHTAVMGEGCHTSEVHDVVAIARRHREESEIVRRVFGLPDNIELEASLTAYRDDYAALKQLHEKQP